MRFLVVVLFSAVAVASDHWETFKPESVKGHGCSIEQVELSVVGAPSVPKWVFTAWAKRDLPAPLDEWRMDIGYYESTEKGRHKAMRDCDKWMHEADKRIKAAQK